jgi:hypothetical protein
MNTCAALVIECHNSQGGLMLIAHNDRKDPRHTLIIMNVLEASSCNELTYDTDNEDPSNSGKVAF